MGLNTFNLPFQKFLGFRNCGIEPMTSMGNTEVFRSKPLAHAGTYAEIPNQPWNPMLASVNLVILEATRIQPEQPEKPEDWVYGSKSEVWPYGLFPGGNISTKVRVSCVYNSTQWGVFQLTINDLYTLWDVPLLLQEKLEELDKNPCWFNFCHRFRGKHWS